MRANRSRLPGHGLFLLAGLCLAPTVGLPSGPAAAQERQPWTEPAEPRERDVRPYDDTRREWERDERDRQPPPSPYAEPYRYSNPSDPPRYGAAPPAPPPPAYDRPAYPGRDDAYRPPQRQDDAYRPPAGPQYGAPYAPPAPAYERGPAHYDNPPPPRRDYDDRPRDGTFSMREILDTGHGFFGSVSQGLASVIEHAFKRQGRPNGYILGEDLGGAFVAGLRYGEGTLYTRDAGNHKVYWQGPSVGYDAGAEGSKVMVLIYNMRDPSEIYDRFGGIAGSAYVVGGVGLTFQSNNYVTVAPIRAGIGLRLGANIGYLKYTRRPTWNPF